MTAIHKFDFDLLLVLAQDDPDRYTDMRSLLINTAIKGLDGTNGNLAQLLQKIDRITGENSAPDQVMQKVARLISDRISTLRALTLLLERELGGNSSHAPTSTLQNV